MQIYSLPDMECILSFKGFSIGWKVLDQSLQETLGHFPLTTEIMICRFEESNPISKPILFAVLDDRTVLPYKSFKKSQAKSASEDWIWTSRETRHGARSDPKTSRFHLIVQEWSNSST